MTNPKAGSNDDALNVFRRHRMYLSGSPAAESLWRKLTPSQQQKLGGSLKNALTHYGKPVYWWMFLNHVTAKRAVVELAIKLFSFPEDDAEWLLREIGELPLDNDLAQAKVISRGDLVLIRTPPTLFWGGELIEIDWGRHQVSWNYFRCVCERAKCNQPIDRLDLGEHARENIVAQEKSRLKSIPNFPAALIKEFKCVGLGTQQLQIPAECIHFFDQ